MAITNTNLYRGVIDGAISDELVSEDGPAKGVLYPRVEADSHFDRSGREWTRRAEMTVFTRDSEMVVDADGGTSLFDVEGWFGHAGWRYFEIPEGTVCPDSLRIRAAHHVTRNRAGRLQGRRHTIEPLTRMSMDAYRGALDNLARNAVVRQIERAR